MNSPAAARSRGSPATAASWASNGSSPRCWRRSNARRACSTRRRSGSKPATGSSGNSSVAPRANSRARPVRPATKVSGAARMVFPHAHSSRRCIRSWRTSSSRKCPDDSSRPARRQAVSRRRWRRSSDCAKALPSAPPSSTRTQACRARAHRSRTRSSWSWARAVVTC